MHGEQCGRPGGGMIEAVLEPALVDCYYCLLRHHRVASAAGARLRRGLPVGTAQGPLSGVRAATGARGQAARRPRGRWPGPSPGSQASEFSASRASLVAGERSTSLACLASLGDGGQPPGHGGGEAGGVWHLKRRSRPPDEPPGTPLALPPGGAGGPGEDGPGPLVVL